MNKKFMIAASVAAALALSGCGKDEPKTIPSGTEEKPVSELPAETKSEDVKVTGKPVSVKPKTVKSVFDSKYSIFAKLGEEERALFSLKPVGKSEKSVTLSLGTTHEGGKIMEKDALVFLIDGTMHPLNAKSGTKTFEVENDLIAKLLEAKEAAILLYLEDGIAYEGDFNLGKENSFKSKIVEFLK